MSNITKTDKQIISEQIELMKYPISEYATKEEYVKYEIELIKKASKRVDYVNKLNELDIYLSDAKTLEELEGDARFEAVRLIKHTVEKMQSNCNFTNKIKTESIIDFAVEVLKTSPFCELKTDDYILFFNKITTGFYGQLYNSIDSTKIYNFLNDYIENRAIEVNAYFANLKHEQLKSKREHEENEKEIKRQQAIKEYNEQVAKGEKPTLEEIQARIDASLQNIGNIKQIN